MPYVATLAAKRLAAGRGADGLKPSPTPLVLVLGDAASRDALAAALCESVAAARVLRLRELMASASEATDTGRQVEELVRQRKIVPTELQLELLAAALPPDDGPPALAVLVDFPKSAVQLAALERRIGRVTCALFAGDPDAPKADMLSVGVARPLKRRRAGGVHAVGTGGASLVAALAALTAEGVLRDGVVVAPAAAPPADPLGWIERRREAAEPLRKRRGAAAEVPRPPHEMRQSGAAADAEEAEALQLRYRALAEIAEWEWSVSAAVDADAPEVDAAAAYVGEGWLRATVLGEFTAAEEGELSVAEKERVLVDGDQMPPTVELMAAEDDGGDAQLVVANCWLRAVRYEDDGGTDGPVPAGQEGALPSTYVHLEDFEIRAEEDYDAQADGEISFRRGDVLLVRPAARMLGRSWWLARVRWSRSATMRGACGLAPRHVLDPHWRQVARLAVRAIVCTWRDYRRGGKGRIAQAQKQVAEATSSADGVRELFSGGRVGAAELAAAQAAVEREAAARGAQHDVQVVEEPDAHREQREIVGVDAEPGGDIWGRP